MEKLGGKNKKAHSAAWRVTHRDQEWKSAGQSGGRLFRASG